MHLELFKYFKYFKPVKVFLINLSLIILLFIAAIYLGIYLRTNNLLLKTVRNQASSGLVHLSSPLSLRLSLTYQRPEQSGIHVRGRMCPTDAERDMQFFDADLIGPDGGCAPQHNRRALADVGDDFDVGPTNSLIATLHRFHGCLFRGPALGEMLVGVGGAKAIFDFVWCVDAFEKLFAVRFDHLCDANAFDDFRSKAKNRHRHSSLR